MAIHHSRTRCETHPGGPLLLVATVFALAVLTLAAPPRAAFAQNDFEDAEIHTLHVRGNIYMLVGPGGNITVQAGEDGVMLVDTKYEELGDKVLAAIRDISDGPITYIINTHAHPDHIGGNAFFAERGSNIAGGDVLNARPDAGSQAKIVAHENVVLSILAQPQEGRLDAVGWPTTPYIGDNRDMFFNGEAIRIHYQPAAHTDGDSVVFFRRTDVISAGDVFNMNGYPYIDVENGGSLQGIIDALNNIIDMTVPAVRQEGGTLVIPGHGRLTDESDVVMYRDMLTIIRDRIQYQIDQGASLQQVLDYAPTYEYDGLFGSDEGFWTTDMFIEAVYNELAQ